MSERFKESVLKTEVFGKIPGVRIPLHPPTALFNISSHVPAVAFKIVMPRRSNKRPC